MVLAAPRGRAIADGLTIAAVHGEIVDDLAELSDKIALVTGGGRGIGRAVARALARAGASLALTGRDPGRLAEAAVEIGAIGGRVVVEPMDVSDPDSMARSLERLLLTIPRIDGPVKHAAIAES